MKDKRGVYYYPVPLNKRVKMYVREVNGVIEFRLHNDDDPKLYEEHGWITYEAARLASDMYKGPGMNPLRLYDIDAAIHALKSEEN
ncbi:hypothetical protein JCM13304A_16110 [Desulfothermus okinawensis JCM 13304]